MTAAPLLEISDLVVEFGGVRALDGVSVAVPEHSTVGIIGPNGAGKSTLINCVTRYYTPKSGDIRYRDQSLAGVRPHHVVGLGIARTFQNLELFERQTVAENIYFGAVHRLRPVPPHRRAERHRLDAETRDRVQELMDGLGLQHTGDQLVRDLPYPLRKRVEFARAMMARPELLMLDEPTAGLGDAESARFTEVIQAARTRHGITIAVIAHDMPFIFALCDRIYVFDAGRVLAHGTPEEVQANPEVRKVYLGESA
ncbi:MAG TPA: ABC transporter ATP-binding protein [Solirubrobacter sp.]|nr:ABC transporter ATP-binding protein [Solirubrobacter sp.]